MSSSERPGEDPGTMRLLVVDDDLLILRAVTRTLEGPGVQIDTAKSGDEALQACRTSSFDVVLTDVQMPGLSGLELLRGIREHDLDLQVILLTGEATLEVATEAINSGAFRFLTKPFQAADLVAATRQAAAATRVARLKRQAFELANQGGTFADRAGLEVKFESALRKLWVAFQPIVRWSTREVLAYEGLVRSDEPALPHPGALLDAADRLGRMQELGRAVRQHAAEFFHGAARPAERLFLNLHATDLLDEQLYGTSAALERLTGRLVYEITERSSLDEVRDVRTRVARLRSQQIGIALDDIGAGYAGLNSFVLLEPDVVKIDMSLVRDVDRTPVKQRLVKSLVAMCEGQLVVAEGVETRSELDCLVGLGCDVFQGYYFAKPARGLPIPRFE